ncbi:MAG: hypothetical protein SFV15_12830 [Polyangiaceae bacterium]|nr:hypothetical protein [Polyangiaceae bacterium]
MPFPAEVWLDFESPLSTIQAKLMQGFESSTESSVRRDRRGNSA